MKSWQETNNWWLVMYDQSSMTNLYLELNRGLAECHTKETTKSRLWNQSLGYLSMKLVSLIPEVMTKTVILPTISKVLNDPLDIQFLLRSVMWLQSYLIASLKVPRQATFFARHSACPRFSFRSRSIILDSS